LFHVCVLIHASCFLMCILFYVSFVWLHVYAIFPWSICKSAFDTGAPGFLMTAPSTVPVPAVLGPLTVWIQNQKKKRHLLSTVIRLGLRNPRKEERKGNKETRKDCFAKIDVKQQPKKKEVLQCKKLRPPKNGEIALWPNTRVVKCTYCVLLHTSNDDDCFYYHSWRNNVVIAFGTLSCFFT